MGEIAYRAFVHACSAVHSDGIAPALIGVLETDRRIIDVLPTFIGSHGVLVDSRQGANVAELLLQKLGLASTGPVLIYDATPSERHYRNMVEICDVFPNAVYLSEKPLFTARKQLSSLAKYGNRVLCDFIETESLPALRLREMQASGLKIERFRFWRLNSIGFQKLLKPRMRTGVTGGAAIDKCIHDLAVAVSLQPCPDASLGEPVVEQADNYAYLPDPSDVSKTRFFTTDGRFARGIDLGTAEAAGYARVRWSSGLEGHFHYGWIGVEAYDRLSRDKRGESLQSFMREIGIEEQLWLYRQKIDAGPYAKFASGDARIAVVEGLYQRSPVRLIVNFLDRPGVQPFIFETGRREFLPLRTHRHGNNSLARVFEHAIRQTQFWARNGTHYLGRGIIENVHRTAFAIREKAFLHQGFVVCDEHLKSMRLMGEQIVQKYAPPGASVGGFNPSQKFQITQHSGVPNETLP